MVKTCRFCIAWYPISEVHFIFSDRKIWNQLPNNTLLCISWFFELNANIRKVSFSKSVSKPYYIRAKIKYSIFIIYYSTSYLFVVVAHLQTSRLTVPYIFHWLIFFVFLDNCLFVQEIYSNIPGDVSISSHNTFQDSKDIWSSAPSDAKVTM